MKRNTVEFLRCPNCSGELNISGTAIPEIIEVGTLICASCQRTYPIIRGIPHFIEVRNLTGQNKTFSHLYDWFSLIYPEFSRIGFRMLGLNEARARGELLSRLEPNGGRVLEVSIGPGVNLPYLVGSPTVGELYGLDISMGQLNRCNALIRRKGWPVDLFLGNGEELPFADACFDAVFHIGGINFFNDKQKAIDEMIRVAKPGTRIIICDENDIGAQWYEKYLPGFKSAFHGLRPAITPPVEYIPPSMLELSCEDIWKGFMYCIQFRKPPEKALEYPTHE